MDELERELERQASAGDVEAKARHIRSLVRSGSMPTGHAHLAAVLGAPAARLLYPDAKVPSPRVRLLRFAAGGVEHAITQRQAYCGRAVAPPRAVPVILGVPTCVRCLQTERWRRKLQDSLVSLIVLMHSVAPLAAFRACIALVEEALPGDTSETDLVHRLITIARWTYCGTPLPREFGGGPLRFDPGGIHAEGLVSWVGNLTEAAWSVHKTGAMTTRNITRLTSDTAAWVRGTADGLNRLDSALLRVRERLLPWLLGDEDPMPLFVHFLETTVVPRA